MLSVWLKKKSYISRLFVVDESIHSKLRKTIWSLLTSFSTSLSQNTKKNKKYFFHPLIPKSSLIKCVAWMCLFVSPSFLLIDWFFPHKLSLWSSLFQLSSLSFIVHKSKEKPQKFHFASRGLASASTTSEDGSSNSINTKEYYLEVGKSQQQFASSPQQQQRKLDLDYLKAMMNLPPQDLQPYSQLQKMAHVAQNSLVNIILQNGFEYRYVD